MTVLAELYLAAVVLLALLALFFIFCRHYEDGLVGNAALGFALLFALIELGDARRDGWAAPAPVQMLLVIAMTVFLARYAIKVVWKHWVERGRPSWLRRAAP